MGNKEGARNRERLYGNPPGTYHKAIGRRGGKTTGSYIKKFKKGQLNNPL